MVVLTFDDGPNDTYSTTERLLDVLEKQAVHAHFCLIGENIRQNPLLTKKIYQGNHSIVNHGMDDKIILFKTASQVEKMDSEWNLLTREALGDSCFRASLFRPASGVYNLSLKKALAHDGLSILPVTFYVGDAQRRPSAKMRILESTLKKIKKKGKAIIVFHDGRDCNEKLKRKLHIQSIKSSAFSNSSSINEFTNSSYKEKYDSSYDRSWVPEIIDSLITALKKDSFQFVLYDSLLNDSKSYTKQSK